MTNYIKNNKQISVKYISVKLLSRFFGLLVWVLQLAKYKKQLEPLVDTISLLIRRNGSTWTVSYLKEAQRLLVHYWTGNPTRCSFKDGTVRVQTKHGIPTLIPGKIRQYIQNTNHPDRDALLRFCLTMISVFRVMKAKPVLKLSTITDPFKGICSTLPVGELGLLWSKKFEHLTIGSYNTNTELLLLKSAGPNHKVSILGAPLDALAFKSEPILLSAFETLSNFFDSKLFTMLSIEMSHVHTCNKSDLKLGKLSCKEEAAGKVRVFAITDVWTQSILNPIHRTIFSILSKIEQDGTMDQAKPITLLMSTLSKRTDRKVYSFDLSAATDRLPIDLQVQVMSLLYNFDVAFAWKDLLVSRTWYLKHPVSKEQIPTKYSVGQPMGALSSWGMLALTHHLIVQLAASRSGFDTWFEDYALLGDDIVIANKVVSEEYLSIMTGLGVEINLSKSVISDNGCIEFAKRLVSPAGEISPIGPKNLLWGVKLKVMIPSLFLDYLGKGKTLSLREVTQIFESTPFHLTAKMKESLIWMICGPFGFIKEDTEQFAPRGVFKSMYHDTPKDFMRNLKDTLLFYNKKEHFSALLTTNESLVSLLEYGVPNEIDTLHPLLLPSRQELLLSGINKSHDLLKKDPRVTLNLSPYTYMEENGKHRARILNEVISGRLEYSPLCNCLVSPPVRIPKLRSLNTDFFNKMKKLDDSHKAMYWGSWSIGINI